MRIFQLRVPCTVLALLLVGTTPLLAAPRIPDRDEAVLERLPIRATDPAARELRELRAALRAQPSNVELALKLARRYFDMASAEGDPRYTGYAEAVIRPWTSQREMPTGVLMMRALLTQYRHDFAPAMVDLSAVLQREPGNAEAMEWQIALDLVQADYAAARGRCEKLAPHATPLAATVCTAVVDSLNGKSRAAYAAVAAALLRNPARDYVVEYRQWLLTRQAEMALRFGDKALAEKHFKEAIATGYNDGFVLAAYSDFLLDEQRPAEVVALLGDRTASDILLLRLALAETALQSPAAAAHRQALADRFAASALRGDKLHQQEEARFELELRKDARRALAAASDNWQKQREPRDARILMEAALAAKQPAAAKPALDWLERTGYEEARYRALGETLRKMAP